MPCQARCARATIFQPWCARRRWCSPWRSGLRVDPRCLRRRRAVSRPTVRSRNAARRAGGDEDRRAKRRSKTPSPNRPPHPTRRRSDTRGPRRGERRGRGGARGQPARARLPGGRNRRRQAQGRPARDFLKKPQVRDRGAGRLLRVRRALVHVQLRRRGRVLPVGRLRPRSPGDADADQVPAGGALQLVRRRAALHAQRRLPGHRVAAVVADPRQVQVHRGDHHPRRHLRAGGRRPDLPRVGARADLGGGLRPQAVLLALRQLPAGRFATS